MNEERLTKKIIKLEENYKSLINRLDKFNHKINKMSKQIEHLRKENELLKKRVNHLEIMKWN